MRVFSNEPGEETWNGQDKKYYEYDALLGWKKIKNLNAKRASAGKQPVDYQINSKGIRGPEYSYSKSDDEYRILILGDSFSDGYMVEFHELFSEVLKNNLNNVRKDRHYESINAGTCGYSTDQEFLYYKSEGKKYNPDLTILMFYQNDLVYINQRKDWGMNYKPLFKLIDGDLVLTNVPVPKPDIFIIHEQLESKKKSVIEKFRGWLDINSYLYKLIKERIKNTYKLRKLAFKANVVNEKTDETVIPIEYRVWEKNYNDTVRDAWKTVEALIVKLRDETSSAGSRFLVFYVPFEGSIYREEWDKLKRVYGLSDQDWSPDQAELVLKDICKKNNIDLMIPTEMLRRKTLEIQNDKERLYDPIDHHWTVEGNKFIGEILADHIASTYLADDDPSLQD